MKVCIVGLGLLGGSVGLSLKERNPDIERIGVETNEEHANIALERNLVSEILPLEEALTVADLIVLATPVDTIVKQLPKVLDLVSKDAVVTDLGSTKELICSAADNHSNRNQFVAAHPIAGTEDSGPEAAFPELLKDKMVIICDTQNSSTEAIERAKIFYESLEMDIQYMDSHSHDLHIAFVSHLSHISSFALGSTVLEKERDEKNIFIMAGSGFSSTVRLAKSSPDMWEPIFRQNKKNVVQALTDYISHLQTFKEMIEKNDFEEVHKFMKETNDIRRVLKGEKE